MKKSDLPEDKQSNWRTIVDELEKIGISIMDDVFD